MNDKAVHRTVIRFPKDLADIAIDIASCKGVSFNSIVVKALKSEVIKSEALLEAGYKKQIGDIEDKLSKLGCK